MDRSSKIASIQQRIEDLRRALDMMPQDTALGRMCIEAYLRQAEKKLKKLFDEK